MYKAVSFLLLSFFILPFQYAQASIEGAASDLSEKQKEQAGFSDPEKLVFDLIHKAVNLEEWRKQDDFFTQLESYFDFSYMGRFVLGRAVKQISDIQLQDFISVFAEIQTLALLPYIKDTDSIKLIKSRSKNNKTILIFSYETENSQAIELGVFLQKNKENNLVKIYDFRIEEVRMLLNWRGQLSSIITRQGFYGMMQGLRSNLEKKKSSLE